MLTIVINTSEESLDVGSLLEVETETNALVLLECPLHKWKDRCPEIVNAIGGLINEYAEFDGTYSIVEYVNLTEDTFNGFDERFGGAENYNRYFFFESVKIYLGEYFKRTLIRELERIDRTPAKHCMLLESREIGEKDATYAWDNVPLRLSWLIGFPDERRIADAQTAPEESEKKILEELPDNEFLPGSAELFGKEAERALEGFAQGLEAKRAYKDAFDALMNGWLIPENLSKEQICVSFQSSRAALNQNVGLSAQRRLRIAEFLHRCTVADRKSFPSEMPEYDRNKVASEFSIKFNTCREALSEIENLIADYSSHHLVPEIKEFDRGKFCLGLNCEDVSEKDKEHKLLDDEISFDYSKIEPPEENVSYAEAHNKVEELKKTHKEYLNGLRDRMKSVFSHYATVSGQRTADEMLPRRRVEVSEIKGYENPETAGSYGDGKNENAEPETVVQEAKKALAAVLARYYEFSANRYVEVTNIERRCDLYLEEIDRIDKATGALSKIFLGGMIALPILYLPFLIIQFHSITSSLFSGLTALGSFCVPFVFFVFGFFGALGSRKHKKEDAWRRLVQDSDKMIQNNKRTAKEFGELVRFHIPALRYVYEYSLDAAFYKECCDLARAKLEHHKEKINALMKTLSNMLKDLQLKPDSNVQAKKISPDYNVPFCVEEQNRTFYTVFDDQRKG